MSGSFESYQALLADRVQRPLPKGRPFKEALGTWTWGLLHAAADEYPCGACRGEFSLLVDGIHDHVNNKLGKPLYDKKRYTDFLHRVGDVAWRDDGVPSLEKREAGCETCVAPVLGGNYDREDVELSQSMLDALADGEDEFDPDYVSPERIRRAAGYGISEGELRHHVRSLREDGRVLAKLQAEARARPIVLTKTDIVYAVLYGGIAAASIIFASNSLNDSFGVNASTPGWKRPRTVVGIGGGLASALLSVVMDSWSPRTRVFLGVLGIALAVDGVVSLREI